MAAHVSAGAQRKRLRFSLLVPSLNTNGNINCIAFKIVLASSEQQKVLIPVLKDGTSNEIQHRVSATSRKRHRSTASL
jgi:hypothetical protein